MLGRLVTRLYTHLLKLYPDRFLDEFGGEMADVFSQTLAGLNVSDSAPVSRRLKMAQLFLREIWDFPHTYLDARHYQSSLDTDKNPAGASYREDVTETWIGPPAPWTAVFVGAVPFLLFGLAYLIEGITELGGHYGPAFNLQEGILLSSPLNHPEFIITTPLGVYFITALGLLIGTLKGFPRWSYAYLGMSIYFGWYYSSGRFFGMVYGMWAWLPLAAAVIPGLILSPLLTRSLQPLARLLQGAWNDWTRLSFALYAFALPVQTVIFLDGDWGVFHLYSLVFDTLLLASLAAAFLRSRTSWGRVLSLEAAILIMVVKGIWMGWMGELDGMLAWPVVFLIISVYIGLLLLPGIIGLLRRGVNTVTSR